jgi:DNA-damage-inducible protein D
MTENIIPSPQHESPFQRIRRVNSVGNEFWSSRDLAEVLGYTDYRNFEQVIAKAKTACFNSGQRLEDHFVDVTEMVRIGSGAERPVPTVYRSRYACYLIIQNADPRKQIVAPGQTYFAVQTRRQELSEQVLEEERRLLLREKIRRHNAKGRRINNCRQVTPVSSPALPWHAHPEPASEDTGVTY